MPKVLKAKRKVSSSALLKAKTSKGRPLRIFEVKRKWKLLKKLNHTEHVYRIDELWQNIIHRMDVIDLLHYKAMDAKSTSEADAEMRRRFTQFICNVVGDGQIESLMTLMADHDAGFGGYEVLKYFVPASKEFEIPEKRVYTLFVPLHKLLPVSTYFRLIGFEIVHVNGDLLEQSRVYYGNAAADCACLRSPTGKVFVDIVESSNDITFFPCFRMPTTLHMQCLFVDRLIAFYGKMSCQLKGILNPAHASGALSLSFEPGVLQAVEELQKKCGVKVHRNARQLMPHDGRCGIDPNCPQTLRSTASGGTVIYPFNRFDFDNSKLLNFLPRNGIVWRLGGWSCYRNGIWGLSPILGVAEGLHTMFKAQKVIEEMPDNEALSKLLGWE